MTTNQDMGRMPVLFVGHGSPMNAIQDNRWSRSFAMLATLLPRPRAVLAISAHWYLPGTWLTDSERPETIHDFGGFPPALFAMQYPAPGDVALARRVVELLGADRAALRSDWGLDHGTWTVLHYLLPHADVPVVQLSLDARLPAAGHFELAAKLKALRDDGVLILASGNLTHNLRDAFGRLQTGRTDIPDWAAQFDAEAVQAIEQRDTSFLARLADSDIGRMAHPTVDHYLPLLYAVGAAEDTDTVSYPIEGFDLGSLSMRSVLFG